MARLNEAPSSNESVDALKRRFIRQNRELAKHNSTQSVRIRCLEAEISRILTENLHLREEILQLRNDLEGVPNKRAFGGVKDQLEAQVQVLAQLVAGIGLSKDQEQVKNNGLPTRYPSVGWGRGMADPMDGSDGRLPAIREDKSYPRRTLDAQEIQTTAEYSSESPALGSPPVSHFQDEEPIKFEKPMNVEIKKESEDLEAIPANLETRRKKRDSSNKLSIRRMSVFSSPEDEAKNGNEEAKPAVVQPASVRTGAKRKLGSRDDDSKPTVDFTFSRKGSSTSTSADESSAKEDKAREPIKATHRRETAKAAPPKLSERKALGEKNVNTDPIVSPKKTTKKSTVQEEKEALKKIVEATKEAPKSRTRDRKSRVTIEEPIITIKPQDDASQPLPVAEITPPETKLDLPPKTPATVADVFSAPSTEDSTRAQPGRDTPPPSDLAASTDANGRPGRRARVQVNYAEPSLAAKMRRPTKELLDAVGKDGRPLSGMIVKKDAGMKLEHQDAMGSAWKNMPSVPTDRLAKIDAEEARGEPGSPLSKKSTLSSEPLQALMKAANQPEPILPSAASQAIAALIKDSKTTAAAAAAARRRSSAAALQRGLDVDVDSERNQERKEKKRGASIYDFASSSPPRSSSITTSRPSSRSSDRHTDTDDGGKPNSRTVARRHSSTASLSSASKESVLDAGRAPTRFGTGVATAGHKRTVSGSVRNMSSDAAAASAGGNCVPELRASRRRSMML